MFKHYSKLKVGDKVQVSRDVTFEIAEVEQDGKRITDTEGIVTLYGICQFGAYVIEDKDGTGKSFKHTILQGEKIRCQDTFIENAEYVMRELSRAIDTVKAGGVINSLGVMQSTGQSVERLSAELGMYEKMIGLIAEKN